MTDRRRLLSSRTAVVTGGARGLGKAIAEELAARGVHVASLRLEGDALTRIATGLPTASRSWAAGITDDDAMVHVAQDVHRLMSPVSIVVANAGVAEFGPFLGSDPDSRRRVIEIDLTGSAVTARSFLPYLLDTRGHYLQITLDRTHRIGADDECLLRVQGRCGILHPLPACRNGS